MRENYARKTPACGEDFKSGHYPNSNMESELRNPEVQDLGDGGLRELTAQAHAISQRSAGGQTLLDAARPKTWQLASLPRLLSHPSNGYSDH
jgi:hypothetical protein